MASEIQSGRGTARETTVPAWWSAACSPPGSCLPRSCAPDLWLLLSTPVAQRSMMEGASGADIGCLRQTVNNSVNVLPAAANKPHAAPVHAVRLSQ